MSLFEPVDKLPEYSTFYARKTELIRNLFATFLSSNVKYARVNLKFLNKSVSLAYVSLRAYSKRHKYPIEVVRKNNEIYLVKT